MIRSLSILMLVLLLVACGDREAPTPDVTLATVNGKPIGLVQYRQGYLEYLFRGGLPDESVRRSAFLNRMIAKELIVAEARQDGVEQTEEFQAAREGARQKMLIEAILADEVSAGVQVTEEDLQDMFVRTNTQLTARHLFTPSLEEAQALYARVQQGETFEDLAPEVFSDPLLASNGGLLGTFGFDEMDPAFEDAAWALKVGEVSPPVRTSQGYSIIRLDDRFVKPILTETEFAERRPKLQGFVRSRKEALARRQFLEGLVDKASVEIDTTVSSWLLDQITSAGLQSGPEDTSRELVRFRRDGRSVVWTVQDFRNAAEATSERQRMAVDNMDDLTAFIEGLVARDLMLNQAEGQGLGRDRRVREGTDAAMSEWIYERAFDQIVSGITFTEADLRTYFETYRDEFQTERKVQLSEIVAATRREADSLRFELRRNRFDELARRHSKRPASAAVGGDLGFLSHDQLGPWADDVFTSREGTVLGPLPAAGKYILLKTGAVEAARPMTFEEARDQVESMLRRERQQAYLRDYVQQLRSRYPVNIVVKSLDDLPLTGTANA